MEGLTPLEEHTNVMTNLALFVAQRRSWDKVFKRLTEFTRNHKLGAHLPEGVDPPSVEEVVAAFNRHFDKEAKITVDDISVKVHDLGDIEIGGDIESPTELVKMKGLKTITRYPPRRREDLMDKRSRVNRILHRIIAGDMPIVEIFRSDGFTTNELVTRAKKDALALKSTISAQCSREIKSKFKTRIVSVMTDDSIVVLLVCVPEWSRRDAIACAYAMTDHIRKEIGE